jgi:hypothetical protein
MFLAGLIFALGLVVGTTFFVGVAAFALIGAARFDRWRERRRRFQWEAKAHAQLRANPQLREHAVFCFRFRTGDWLSKSGKTEYWR